MNRPLFLSLVLLFALSVGHAGATQPNIIFILVDDMGYGDLGCYGAPDARTPNLDQLAAEGVRFTQCYANGAECTPSRTSILTGRYPQRVGGLECAIGTGNVGRYDDAITLAEQHDLGLPAEYAILAPGLKKVGYATGVFGKWHLGYEPKFSPLDQGFDQFRGFLGGNVEYFHHVELSDLEVVLDGREPVKREGYMTHIITNDAIDFIEAQAQDAEHPFFLYVPYGAPHFPFQGPRDAGQPRHSKELWTVGERSKYVEMLEDMDTEVGRILTALQRSGEAEDTLVVFASDHGAIAPGSNAPFRDFKSTLFEGGIRVPCIARWPGRIASGVESTQVACLMDLTRSFLSVGGAEVPADLDGIDLMKHVVDGHADEPRHLFWRARRGDLTWTAARMGDRKYVRKAEGEAVEEWFFDLASDPGESNSLIGQSQASLEDVKQGLAEWEAEVKPARPQS